MGIRLYNMAIAASVTATAQSILLPMIQQLYPAIVANTILGVQPITGRTGNIFTMGFSYEDPNIAKFHKKYKFSRAKWFYCDYKYTDEQAVFDWCNEHFGVQSKGGDAWMRWKLEFYKIRFRDEDDAIMFKLRWSK